jgi:hypothetical protein
MARPEYEFDLRPFVKDGKLTRRVYRGRAVFGENDPVPLLSVLEGPLPDRDPLTVGMNEIVREDDWPLFVQGWTQATEDHSDSPTDSCYQFMAGVERRMSEIISVRRSGLPVNPEAYMLGGTVSGLSIGPGVVRPPQDQVSSRAFFYLPVVVRLPVDVSQPFVTA